MIYFIQCGENGPIKIGHSNYPDSRYRGIATANPSQVSLLCIIPGDKKVERDLHKRWKHFKLRGEWYRPDPEILAFVGENKSDQELASNSDCPISFQPPLLEWPHVTLDGFSPNGPSFTSFQTPFLVQPCQPLLPAVTSTTVSKSQADLRQWAVLVFLEPGLLGLERYCRERPGGRTDEGWLGRNGIVGKLRYLVGWQARNANPEVVRSSSFTVAYNHLHEAYFGQAVPW